MFVSKIKENTSFQQPVNNVAKAKSAQVQREADQGYCRLSSFSNETGAHAASDDITNYSSLLTESQRNSFMPYGNSCSKSRQEMNYVQKKAPDGQSAAGENTSAIHQAAARGVSGAGNQLPHFATIQKAFGSHDISHVKAYTGSSAEVANKAIGAEAYATGNKIAFAERHPDLHTAAHEAAHIIQQRGGVRLKEGVGKVGDQYEQHADTVADAVVQGRSVEKLLEKGISRRIDAQDPPNINRYSNNVQMAVEQGLLKGTRVKVIATGKIGTIFKWDKIAKKYTVNIDGDKGNGKKYSCDDLNPLDNESSSSKKTVKNKKATKSVSTTNSVEKKVTGIEEEQEEISATDKKDDSISTRTMTAEKKEDSGKAQQDTGLEKEEAIKLLNESVSTNMMRLLDESMQASTAKDFIRKQSELQAIIMKAEDRKLDIRGLFTTAGFEFEFLQMSQDGPLQGITHLEIAESEQKMPYFDLPFKLETDAQNELELVTPPFFVGSISQEHPIPNPNHLHAINKLFIDVLNNDSILSGQKIIQLEVLTQYFINNLGLKFPINDVAIKVENFTPKTKIYRKNTKASESKQDKTDDIKVSEDTINKMKVERNKKHKAGVIDTQVNFATDADIYHQIKDLPLEDKTSVYLKLNEVDKSILEYIRETFKEEINPKLAIFLSELSRVLAGQIAVPAINRVREYQEKRSKADQYSGSGELKKMSDAMDEHGLSSHVKDTKQVWIKDNLMNIGIGLLNNTDWGLVKKIVEVLINFIPSLQIKKLHKDLKEDAEVAEKYMIDVLKKISNYIDASKLSELTASGSEPIKYEPVTFMQHNPQFLGARQDTYIPHNKVQLPNIWPNNRLHVVETRHSIDVINNLPKISSDLKSSNLKGDVKDSRNMSEVKASNISKAKASQAANVSTLLLEKQDDIIFCFESEKYALEMQWKKGQEFEVLNKTTNMVHKYKVLRSYTPAAKSNVKITDFTKEISKSKYKE